MDTFEALYTTRAMRRLRSDPIPPETVARILDAAIRAPAGGGTLRVRFVAVSDCDTKATIGSLWRAAFSARRASHFDPEIARLAASADEDGADKLTKLVASSQYLADHFEDAPLVLFAFGLPGDEASVFPAMWSACLAARALGIGSVFTRILVRDACEAVEEVIGAAGSGWRLQGVLPMGRPLGRWGVPARPDVTEACYAERWGTPVQWTAPPYGWWNIGLDASSTLA